MAKIREPIQGLRIKVRNYLRQNGVEGKFKTQVNRDKTISILGDVSHTNITTFQEYTLKYGSLSLKPTNIIPPTIKLK